MVASKAYLSLPIAAWETPKRNFPRKFHRLLVIGLIAAAFVTVHLMVKLTTPTHHAPFTAPDMDPEIHGTYVSSYIAGPRVPAYPLHRFPETPMVAPPDRPGSYSDGTNGDGDDADEQRRRNPWLAAVISSAFDADRRMLIRSTWMRTYKDLPMDTRFVVSNPGPQWTEVLRAENRTFGDLIVLDHLQEDDFTANTIKTLEFYKHLVRRGLRYEYVSKLDSDLFLNARGFWDRYLRPRLSLRTGEATVERTAIGELYYGRFNDLTFLHGSMYTYTWDVVEELVELQERYHVVAGEDVAMALLLLRARRAVNVVNFLGSEKFDYYEEDSRGDGTPWARAGTHPNATKHALWGPDPIAIHDLKDPAVYLRVASAFDERGIRPTPPLPRGGGRRGSFVMLWLDFWHAVGATTYLTPRVERIPAYFWSRRDNGDWMCDDIWNVGKTRTGHQPPRKVW
ncbi:hypothetical protein B0T11DRAFT_275325 [Plectosphaerella cucumerina]|jgi:beta-1,3-galactosyltransferase 1|uniref:Hexosyltransferase n=1 Tax=Plectosphaerella cucumerina TaxID=40658 RepID=A0A8K0TQ48_9PEZI|nr:hypothetical protein B0T11DRAFT_275325 [Plectosphaerella cucumerina]